ncbi:hypothetical protein MPSEU_000396400 [Mayamaea pseudoterrestris]|nr:hypothetical protein MPSEU_000396400 [Mayamaea pseudoterrestris]
MARPAHPSSSSAHDAPQQHHSMPASSSVALDISPSKLKTLKQQQQQQSNTAAVKPSWTIVHFMLFAIGIGCVLCAASSFYMIHSVPDALALSGHGPYMKTERMNEKQSDNDKIIQNGMVVSETANKVQLQQQQQQQQPQSTLAGLNCVAHGGPSDASEMVYWRDVASDQRFVSPFRIQQGPRQYMTFEPDGGGWNNIRMAMETVLGLAVATGRTLVLPPAQRMYLLAKDRDKHKTEFTFADFFPLEEVSREHAGLDIISMKDFLEETAMKGTLRNKYTGEVEFPPDNNRTDWDGQDFTILKVWLRNVTITPLWAPHKCLAAFPAKGGSADVEELMTMQQQIAADGQPQQEFVDNPVPVDAAPMERMKENLSGRKELCVYDEEMQKAPVLHFMCSHKLRVRMLVHFYAFLFFEDWREDLWMKRFMRDHVRYADEIQCAAARIVAAMREYARSKPGNQNGEFDTFHIRRGDFQFKQTRISAEEIYENIKDVLPDGSIVYVATDERDKSFFDPLKQHYDLKFMSDFKDAIEGVNTNYYGMIDQLVASRGVKFFGCWHSTFTGFINRMRAYHAIKDKSPGHEKGVLPTSYYYVLQKSRDAMHKYSVLHGAFFNREFPVSWKDIDRGVEELAARAQS